MKLFRVGEGNLIIRFPNLLRYNSFLVSFLLFLYGLSNFISIFLPFPVVVSGLTVLFVFPSLFFSCNNINIKFLFAFISGIILIGWQYLIHWDNDIGTLKTFLYFVSIGVVGLFIGSNKIEWNYVFHDMKYLAIINIVFNILYLRFSYGNIDMLSMAFAYGILPSGMFFLYVMFHQKSIFATILVLFISVLIFIWGSRGALLVMLIYTILFLYKKHKKILFLAILIGVFGYQLIVDLLVRFIDVLPIESLKLNKMMLMLTEGIASASSGRDVLYKKYWELFENNFLFGNGVCFWEATNTLYPHNLVLQAGLEFGIVGMFLMMVFICYSLYKIIKTQNIGSEYLMILFSIVLGRLLVSSSYWERPEFWLLLSLVLLGRKQYA